MKMAQKRVENEFSAMKDVFHQMRVAIFHSQEWAVLQRERLDVT